MAQNTLQYDPTNAESIAKFAEGLIGKSLREAIDVSLITENANNKGDLGSLVEKYYFGWIPPSNHGPDFPDAGLELKTTGVLKKKKAGKNFFGAKERLSLTMINYMKIVDEDWEVSTVMEKCKLMLLLLYLYDKQLSVLDRKFIYDPILWRFPIQDLEIIRKDWEAIVEKIKEGKAHELSEGDTLYLGACTKGPGGPPKNRQPFSDKLAPSRAFSLKQKYVNTIIDIQTLNETAESILSATDDASNFEQLVVSRLAKFKGNSYEQIADAVGMDKVSSAKHKFALLAYRMLGIKRAKALEFEKADIIVKTVILQPNGVPEQSMSFRNFQYTEIINETWDTSDFKEDLEKRFLLIVYTKGKDGIVRFSHGKFWSMSWNDREEARRVWEETRKRIIDEKAENLPLTSFSSVAHVRPHGRNGNDKIPTPQGINLAKKCFWLNAKYVAEQVKI